MKSSRWDMLSVGCGDVQKRGHPPASPLLRGQRFVSAGSSSKLLCFRDSLWALTVGVVAASCGCYLHESSFLPFWLPN